MTWQLYKKQKQLTKNSFNPCNITGWGDSGKVTSLNPVNRFLLVNWLLQNMVFHTQLFLDNVTYILPQKSVWGKSQKRQTLKIWYTIITYFKITSFSFYLQSFTKWDSNFFSTSSWISGWIRHNSFHIHMQVIILRSDPRSWSWR